MTDTSKKARVLSRITTWTLRIMLVATVLIFLAVIMTAGLGGNGPTQRKSLEAMFGGVFGGPVAIHQLNTYQLFPDFKIDLGGMVVMNRQDRVPVAVLEKGVFIQESLAEMLGRYPVKAAAFDHFITKPGYMGPYSLHIKKGEILPTTTDATTFHMSGDYGDYDVMADIPLRAAQTGDIWRYRANSDVPIRVQTGDTTINFQFQLAKDKVILNPVTIENAHGKVVGTVVIPDRAVDKNMMFKFLDPATNDTVTGRLLIERDTVTLEVDKGQDTRRFKEIFAPFYTMMTHVKQRDETGKLLPKPDFRVVTPAP